MGHTTDDVKQIDVRFMRRQHYLIPGVASKLYWTSDGEPAGNIDFETEVHRLILRYRYQRSDGSWHPIEEFVPLERTPCNYGGARTWFLCPHCGKRAALLYGLGPRFLCRHCYQLPYTSQNETYEDRMRRRARKIRRRLGASMNLFEPLPFIKPKGMHQKTFDRLRAEEEAANQASLMAMARSFGLLDRLT